jgi:hypothetical protein
MDTLVQRTGSTHVCPVIHPSIHSFIHSFWRFHVQKMEYFTRFFLFLVHKTFFLWDFYFYFKISTFCEIIYLNSAKVLW